MAKRKVTNMTTGDLIIKANKVAGITLDVAIPSEVLILGDLPPEDVKQLKKEAAMAMSMALLDKHPASISVSEGKDSMLIKQNLLVFTPEQLVDFIVEL